MDGEHYNTQFEFTTSLFPKKIMGLCIRLCFVGAHPFLTREYFP